VGVLAGVAGAVTDIGAILASALTGASGVLMLAPTATASANVDEAQVAIYRSVDPPELAQILATQQYAPAPNGSEQKQFWLNAGSAQQYANMILAKGWATSQTIVQSFVGHETFSMGLQMQLDGMAAISFPITALPAVNADAARNGGIVPMQTYTGGR